MIQDHGETSRDSLERGESVRGFSHHTDGQLGCGIRSGLPARFFLVCCTWIDGVIGEIWAFALSLAENRSDSIRYSTVL